MINLTFCPAILFIFFYPCFQQKTDDDDSGNDEPSDLGLTDFKDYPYMNSPEAAAAAAIVPRRMDPIRQPVPQPSKIDRSVLKS